MKNNLVVLIAVALVIILAVSGAWYLLNSRKPYTGPPESITIALPPVEPSALIYIADDQHMFARNGLNVTILDRDPGLAAVNSLLNNEADMAGAAEFIVVGKVFKKINVSVIGSVDNVQYIYIIGCKDRGIEDVSDLKGKKIGLPRGTIAEFYLGRYLDLHGMSMKDLTLVDLNLSKSADMIANGDVDAVIIWQPYVNDIKERLGNNYVIWPAQSNQDMFWVIVCKEDWIEENPGRVNRFLKSLAQAEEYAIYHPAEAKAIVQKRLNFDDAYMDMVWQQNHYSLSLTQSLILAMEDEGRWMIRNNITSEKSIPDYRDYIYMNGLDAVKPDSVDIIR